MYCLCEILVSTVQFTEVVSSVFLTEGAGLVSYELVIIISFSQFMFSIWTKLGFPPLTVGSKSQIDN